MMKHWCVWWGGGGGGSEGQSGDRAKTDSYKSTKAVGKNVRLSIYICSKVK